MKFKLMSGVVVAFFMASFVTADTRQKEEPRKGAGYERSTQGKDFRMLKDYFRAEKEEINEKVGKANATEAKNGLKVTMASSDLFKEKSQKLTQEGRQTLDSLSSTLKKYEDTNLYVYSPVSSPDSLKNKQVQAVVSELQKNGIPANRIKAERPAKIEESPSRAQWEGTERSAPQGGEGEWTAPAESEESLMSAPDDNIVIFVEANDTLRKKYQGGT